MALLNDLIGNLMLAAPGAPEPLAEGRYRDAARKFCTETLAYRAEVTAVGYTGTGEYLLLAPADTEIFDALSVTLDDEPLEKATRVQLRRYAREGRTGNPRWFRIDMGRLYLSPDPGEDIATRLSVIAALRPTRTALSLDDGLAEEFGETFESGAIARLLSAPGQSWTDHAGSAIFWSNFNLEISRWRDRAADEGMRGVPRTVRYGGY